MINCVNNLWIIYLVDCTLFLEQDLKLALSESSAKWKIVVGHHSIRSIGHHGDTKELVSKLLPILKVNTITRIQFPFSLIKWFSTPDWS
jgi:hypothetical protein